MNRRPPHWNSERHRRWTSVRRWTLPVFYRWILLGGAGAFLVVSLSPWAGVVSWANAQDLEQQENQLIREFQLPSAPPPAPVYRPAPAPAPAPSFEEPIRSTAGREPAPAASEPQVEPGTDSPASTSPAAVAEPARAGSRTEAIAAGPTSQYTLMFNRNPVVGNRLRLRGVIDEKRLGFTRPQGWNMRAVQAVIRYQHSPSLLAKRSNLTVRVNGTSVGSVPLARRDGQIGEFTVKIPPNLIQDFNEISVVGQHNTSECSNPADPTLWSEVLPDSHLVFDYQSQPLKLDFKHYPYPIFDRLALDDNQVAYATPAQYSEEWLTATARYQASLGRQADFRPLQTKLVKSASELDWSDRLVVIGTPAEQPLLKSLKLPFPIAGNQVLDGAKTPLPDDVGVLILTTTATGRNPVLVATGNGPEGVQRAVQFLLQPKSEKLGTGNSILVTELSEVSSPDPRAWPQHLPVDNRFKLSDRPLGKALDSTETFKDITVRGSSTPPVDIPFRALPDDRFLRGNTMNLVYSYGPQMNSRTSTVEVRLDGVAIAGRRLTSDSGANRERLSVNLPEKLIKPTSKLEVAFQLNPREAAKCGVITDQQLWATLHADTSFELKREVSVDLPNLELVQVGYPFGSPQDLADTALVVPDAPSNAEVLTLLEMSERLGRLSQSESIQLSAFMASSTSLDEVKQQKHLIGIGTRERFPFSDALKQSNFLLGNAFSRQAQGDAIQTLPDQGGVIKEVLSPWNSQRVLLALTAQTDTGLKTIQQILGNDSWFFRLKGDTVLVSANDSAQSIYDPDAFQLESLSESRTRRFDRVTPLSKASRFIQENWIVLPTAVVLVALLLYATTQILLKRASGDK